MIHIVIITVSLVVAALTLFSGFGLGTLLMPVFAVFFPIELAVAATAVVHLANNIFKIILVGRKADRRIVLLFALPAAISAIAGAWILTHLTDIQPLFTYNLGARECDITVVKLTVAALIAFFSLFEMIPRFEKLSFDSKFIPLGGLLSGFFGGLSGHQGAMRSAFLIKAGLDKDGFIGTSVVSAVIVDVSRLVVYGAVFFTTHFDALSDNSIGSVVLTGTIAAFAGSFAGTRLLKKITLKTIQWIVGIMLLLMSVAMSAGII